MHISRLNTVHPKMSIRPPQASTMRFGDHAMAKRVEDQFRKLRDDLRSGQLRIAQITSPGDRRELILGRSDTGQQFQQGKLPQRIAGILTQTGNDGPIQFTFEVLTRDQDEIGEKRWQIGLPGLKQSYGYRDFRDQSETVDPSGITINNSLIIFRDLRPGDSDNPPAESPCIDVEALSPEGQKRLWEVYDVLIEKVKDFARAPRQVW